MAINFTRPEFALEVVPDGAIAARRQADSGRLAASAFVPFEAGAAQALFAPYIDKEAPKVPLPGIVEGDPAARAGIVAAVKRALEEVGARTGAITLLLPDTAVRIVMLDFDTLPDKEADALGVVRFRLRKLVPFEMDDAQVSYQVLSGERGKQGAIRALAVVIPNAMLRAYEEVVLAAGFEPGVVLPSTLAALGMVDAGTATMLVQATAHYVTTAIARGQDILLHRTHELPRTGATPAVESHTPTAEQVREALDFLGQGDSPEAAAAVAEAAHHDADAFGEFPAPVEDAASRDDELVHAMSVAAAFYEDFTGRPPHPVHVCGSLGVRAWEALLLTDADEHTFPLEEIVSVEDMGAAAASGMSRAQLAAVCGALRG